ncbi:hypothetical protein HCB33_11845 [Listeria sp. FSL L7-0233]|uniref:hypothetical protein n=1 Tax=Listeria cossartiae TaxID=2838249 RepID=UPI00162667F0|nr:hypothetical protein [Listeria cossartiae]MBC1544246.1 hypothetical protein [Listeria cossartiae subsp. cossartiae]MBC1568631.1 hypothetical protein [Listeria cossartiae subsp. cossartiae]MBC1571771.1 hypothetical protein [Listeria cossartiae subsp. cossartiae]MBC2184048.1 hypothetical protein [Listeria cossartiae subsp. cossartiae]MCD2223147.1 hypothetical protein [Listeria cossartiae]
MTIKITRKTGYMGGAAPVKLIVNAGESISLGNGESHTITADKVKVKAAQFGFQSQERNIEDSGEFFIKINSNMLVLFFIMIFCICIGSALNIFMISIVGLIAAIVGLFLGRNHWFKIVKADE